MHMLKPYLDALAILRLFSFRPRHLLSFYSAALIEMGWNTISMNIGTTFKKPTRARLMKPGFHPGEHSTVSHSLSP